MARRSGHKNNYSFTGGIITEASPLTSPENAARSMVNFDIESSGKVSRRLGVDYETDYQFAFTQARQAIIDGGAINTFEWKSVSGVGDKDFIVVHLDYILYFFDVSADPLSRGRVGSIDLTSFALPGTTLTQEFEFSSGKGFLFVTSPTNEVVAIAYDLGAGTFSTTQVNLEVRDFDGIDESVANDTRLATLTSTHEYNLRNQGWATKFRCSNRADGDTGTTLTDPIDWTFQTSSGDGLNLFPSNADVLYLGKLASADRAEAIGAYHPQQLDKIQSGTTRAPRGHFILGAFQKDRSTASGIGGLPNEAILARPGATAFFAGRVFYAGTPDSELAGTVYYSQLLTGIEKAGRCYQDQDPTAEQLNTLLDTDGGLVEIPNIGNVFKMISLQDSLLIFANNGVWAIKGSVDTGFTPSTFSISLITNVGALAKGSIVELNGQVAYWSDNGIMVLGSTQVGDRFVAENISQPTIADLYTAISDTSKATVRGFFDIETKKVFWGYNSDTSLTEITNQLDKFLILNLNLGAFYEYTVGSLTGSSNDLSPFIAGMVRKPGLAIKPTVLDVVENVFDVVEGADDVVETQDLLVGVGDSAVKFFTLFPTNTGSDVYRGTFSELRETTFVDWLQAGTDEATLTPDTGVTYESSLETGYELLGDASREKQIKFIMFHFERTETALVLVGGVTEFDLPSSALVTVKFEWTDVSTVNRWFPEFEAYILKEDLLAGAAGAFDYGFTVINFKHRVRGHGRAITYKIRSSTGKDLRLLGWDVEYTARTRF